MNLCNKYNARTETQLMFGERAEKELGVVCDFNVYVITRGWGWSKSDGCCSASVGVRSKDGSHICNLVLYYPLRNYLSKRKFWSFWQEMLDIHIELENEERLAGKVNEDKLLFCGRKKK